MWNGKTFIGPAVGAFLGAVVCGLGGCAPPEPGVREDPVAVRIPEITTSADFDAQVVKARGAVLVEFTRSPCKACEVLAPTIDRLAGRYRGRAAFFRVDVGEAHAVAAAYDVHATPSVLVFRDGRQVASPIVGAYLEGTYRQALDKALAR